MQYVITTESSENPGTYVFLHSWKEPTTIKREHGSSLGLSLVWKHNAYEGIRFDTRVQAQIAVDSLGVGEVSPLFSLFKRENK